MFKRTIIGLIAGLLAAAGAQAVVVDGRTYADEAAVDALLGSSGSYTTSGGSLADVLTDLNGGTYAFSFSQGASVTLGWTQLLVSNGGGNDIDLYELGVPGTLDVTINGNTRSYLTVDTGFSAGGFALNRAEIDLTDFGLAVDATISSIFIGMDSVAERNPVPSLSFVGATNTTANGVPEPATLALLGLGLAGLGFSRRKQ